MWMENGSNSIGFPDGFECEFLQKYLKIWQPNFTILPKNSSTHVNKMKRKMKMSYETLKKSIHLDFQQ